MNKKTISKQESGSGALEYVSILPLFILLLGLIIGAGIFGYTTIVANISAYKAVREASLYRNGNQIAPQIGYNDFALSSATLIGEAGTDAIGTPDIALNPVFRFVRLIVNGGQSYSFGPVSGGIQFNGGGASRAQLFYPGPPDPWE